MSGKIATIVLILAFFCILFGCDESGGPYRPSDGEMYPGTRILFGVNFSKNQANELVADTIYFDDGKSDTLPYNSRLEMYYYGFDNACDVVFYDFPAVEMRYLFRFWRCGSPIEGDLLGIYQTPWYPAAGAEDTRCRTNLDGTSMRIGTYEYRFMVRSFDDEFNSDTTPDTVRFVGNFPPAIDEALIGYDAEPLAPEVSFTPFEGNTLCLGLDKVFQFRSDTASAYQVDFDPGEMVYIYRYKIILKASGHDDHRDPPGSGIKAWLYSMQGAEDYYYPGEDEWVYGNPINEYYQEIRFQVDVPYDTETGGPDFSILDDQPGFLGEQELTIIGADIDLDEKFLESIRAISPEFDPNDPCRETSPGKFISIVRTPYRYARRDTYSKSLFMKLVK